MEAVEAIIPKIWEILSIASFALPVLLFLILAILYGKTKKGLSFQWNGSVCVAVALVIIALPLHMANNERYLFSETADSEFFLIANLLYSLARVAYNVVQMFTVGGEFAHVSDLMYATDGEGVVLLIPSFAEKVFTVVGNIIYIIAPVLTFTLILSFLKNTFSRIHYRHFCRGKKRHIFSELNEKSLALAKSIKEKEKNRAVVVFCDIIDKKEEAHLDLVEGAKKLGAIFFRMDMESIRLAGKRRVRSKRKIDALAEDTGRIRSGKYNFYLICDDEAEIVRHARRLIQDYGARADCNLYIFSNNEESRSFLDSFSENERNEIAMRVERVDDIRFLIYHDLDQNPLRLFENAREKENIKEISAVIVGLGRYGMEMIKALLWYCQIPGYRVRILALEERADADKRFLAKCPSLKLNTEMNGTDDMRYSIEIVGGVDVSSVDFKQQLDRLDPTYVFISLGSDAENLKISMAARRILDGRGCKADITTVVYSSALKERVHCDYDKKTEGLDKESQKTVSPMAKYRLHVIGDMESFYSVDTVLASTLVEDGYRIHKQWGDLRGFYMNDYNFYSSVAKALHYRLRKAMMRRTEENFLYRDVFAAVFDNEWHRYIVENTGDVKQARAVKRSFEEMIALRCDNTEPIISAEEKLETLEEDPGKILLTPFSYASGDGLHMEKTGDIVAFARAAAEIDHVRWNAYMRTEGFVYGDKHTEFKRHGDLVRVKKLSLKNCIKDI